MFYDAKQVSVHRFVRSLHTVVQFTLYIVIGENVCLWEYYLYIRVVTKLNPGSELPDAKKQSHPPFPTGTVLCNFREQRPPGG